MNASENITMNETRPLSGSGGVITVVDERKNKDNRRLSFRDKLKAFLHSPTVHWAIVALVILDCVIVIIELLIDFELERECNHDKAVNVTQEDGEESHETHPIGESIVETLHYIGTFTLFIFAIEILLKLFAFRFEFFHNKLEVFDAVVIIISLTLDLIFIHAKNVLQFLGLVIILRLWRVIRIVNGIIISVTSPLEDELEEKEKLNNELKNELKDANVRIKSLEEEMARMSEKLKNNGIKGYDDNDVPASHDMAS